MPGLSGDGGDRSSAGLGSSRSSGAGNNSSSSAGASGGGHSLSGDGGSRGSAGTGSSRSNGGYSGASGGTNTGGSGRATSAGAATGRSSGYSGGSSSRNSAGANSSRNSNGGRSDTPSSARNSSNNIGGSSTGNRVGSGGFGAVGSNPDPSRFGGPAVGSMPDPSRFGGLGGRVGVGAISAPSAMGPIGGVDPSRFGDTPTGFAVAAPGNRVGLGGFAGGIDPTRFGGGMADPAAASMAAAARAAENKSMTDLTSMQRGQYAEAVDQGKRSYRAAADRTAAFNAQKESFRASEMQAESLRSYDLAVDRAIKNDAGTANPYNVLSGGKHVDLEGMTIGEVIGMQAGMRAKGHPSTAVGGVQALKGTLEAAVDKLGLDMNTKFDRVTQRTIGRALVDARVEKSRKPDGTVDPKELAHQLANEWAAFSSPKLGRGVYDNDGVNKASVPAKDVQEMANQIAAAANNQKPTQSRFAQNYLGQVQTARAKTEGVPNTAVAATGTYNISVPAGTKEADYFGEQSTDRPSLDDAIGGKNEAQIRAGSATASVGADTRTPREIAYGKTVDPTAPNAMDPSVPAGPYGVGVPGNRPKTNPDYKRGAVGDIVAGGIDVLAGSIPGVGQAASLANLGLAIMGKPTIGGMVVDYVGRNPNQYEPGQTADRGAGGFGSSTELGRLPAKTVVKRGATKPTAPFEDKYLPFVDPVKRPTPAQKWGINTETYGSREYV